MTLRIVTLLLTLSSLWAWQPPATGKPAVAAPLKVNCTTTTADAERTTVQAAIDSAAAGAVVCVPTDDATWTSAVTISGKALTVRGATTCTGAGATLACTDLTNITCNASRCLTLTTTTTNVVSFGGFSFTMTVSNVFGNIGLNGDMGATASGRFHHVHITDTDVDGGNLINTDAFYGLVDHVRVNWSGTSHVFGVFGEFSSAGFDSWASAQAWGDAKALYIEDSLFQPSGATDGILDGFAGGRAVFRYNQATYTSAAAGDMIGVHGLDSGGYRSHMTLEVYNNTFTNNTVNTLQPGRIRGGTLLWHDNTYNGSGSFNGVLLQMYRQCGLPGGWNVCDGTDYKATPADGPPSSSWSASAGGTYNFCAINRDTYCTVNATCSAITGGDTCTGFLDSDTASGYLCRDQPGTGHNQASTPAYAWSNGSITLSADSSCGGGTHMQSGRDYFNTSLGGYTPYIYPHPLSTGG